MAKILVVDDEPDLEVLVKQKFRKQIRDGNYEFVFERAPFPEKPRPRQFSSGMGSTSAKRTGISDE